MFGAPAAPIGAGARMRTSVGSQVGQSISFAFAGHPGTSGSSSFNSYSPSIAAPPPVSGGGAGSVTSAAGATTPPVSTTVMPSRSSTPSLSIIRDGGSLAREVTSARASSPTIFRQASFFSPRQSTPQAAPVSSQPFGKPTASWPSSAPTRQISARSLGTVAQPLPAPPIARPVAVGTAVGSSVQVWPQGFDPATPRSVSTIEMGTEVRTVEAHLVRQSSAPRISMVRRATSIERPSLMGSREASPERVLLPASWRQEGMEAPKSAVSQTSVQPSGQSPQDSVPEARGLPEVQTEEVLAEVIHEPPRKGSRTSVRGKAGAGGQSNSGSTISGMPKTLSTARLAKHAMKDTATSRGRVVSPRAKRVARQSTGGNSSICDEAVATSRSMFSPREDRMMPRNGSQVDLRGDASSPREKENAQELRMIAALRRELEDSKHENSRLQDKLCKARNQITLLQRQAEEARSEREREHRRAEGLQLSAQQLQRQLRKECAKSHLLERSLSEQTKRAEMSVTVERSAQQMPEELPPVANPLVDEGDCGSMSNGISVDTKVLEIAEEADGTFASLISEAEAPPTLEKSWEFVVQGQHDPIEQPDFAAKLVSCFPDDAVERAWSRGVACICSRGRRLDGTVPNQDDFLIARHTLAHDGHIALYGVFDGHGPAGHHCAAFARGSLPESLFGQHTLLMKPEDTLRAAFQQTQANLLQQPFDTENSGTTAALALVLNIPSAPATSETEEQQARQCETWLFVAHVGDSRVLLASHLNEETTSFSVTPLTRDHRPDDAEEAERVCRDGGEVRKMSRNSGSVRVFASGEDRPALALTRSLGVSSASDCGVTSVPEVSAYRLRPGVDVLLLLGTDGLFEFCNPQDAVEKLIRETSVSVLDEVCTFSREQWEQSSYNQTVDDITAIAVSLPSNIG